MSANAVVQDARMRLVEVAGQTAQDLGLGRITGQILVALYLSSGPRSLDSLCDELGLSKAAVSIAARQLVGLGLLHRSRRRGDRKAYYRTADNVATALHQGLLILVRTKLALLATELGQAEARLRELGDSDREGGFLLGRVRRAQKLRSTAMGILENPVVRLLAQVR